MAILRFPDPRQADENGIVAIGGDLEPQSLLLAYRQGIFPWPVEGLPLLWFCPAERGVLEFAELHVPRSLERARRLSRFHCTIDAAFPRVIARCAKVPRPGQDGTWITAEIERAYNRLHALGVAHSVETWHGDRLVGGVYGVEVDGAFAAESMFHLSADASKVALLHLIEHLRSRGLDWFDIQVLTPHMERLGAKAIDRDVFLRKLERTRACGRSLFGGNVTS
jgi:leucyl/phenylalanyl-tRNA--protein transferase